MSMNVIAINIALLLSKDMNDIIVGINHKCISQEPGIIFKNDKAMPHISLLMGSIKDENQEKVESLIADIVSKYSVLDLEVVKVNVAKYGSDLSVKQTSQLQKLHEEIVRNLSPYFTKGISQNSFINYKDSNTEAFQSRITYVENFAVESSLGEYYPHITFAAGKWREEDIGITLPIRLKAVSIGLFQLGDYCTCAKRLASFRLREGDNAKK